jgi:cytochrome c-type biogenesis protein CcmH/NrfG
LAIAGLASAASRRGDHGAARTLAEQVLAAEPGYPDAVIFLARADLAEGEHAAAEVRLHDMIADGRTSEGQRKLAQALLEEVQAAKARKFDA